MCGNGQGNGMMGINGHGGGPNMGMQQPNPGMPQMGQMAMQNGMQPGLQPPGASYGGGNAQMPPQMGQFPPRQAGGPMGPPMTDPNSAGGNFAPQGQWSHYLAMLRGGRQ